MNQVAGWNAKSGSFIAVAQLSRDEKHFTLLISREKSKMYEEKRKRNKVSTT